MAQMATRGANTLEEEEECGRTTDWVGTLAIIQQQTLKQTWRRSSTFKNKIQSLGDASELWIKKKKKQNMKIPNNVFF